MKLLDIEIKNIRGIKDLTLHPAGENLVIWGNNGSGKSAVVDSIDYLLTGNISRLTGPGTAGVSLKKHGPHIDCADPSEAYVKLLVNANDQEFELQRSLSNPNEMICTPEDASFIDSLSQIAKSGHHILTRREILKFIASKGSTRSKEIESIMNLELVGTLRSSFVALKNKAKNAYQATQSNLLKAKTNIASRLGLPNYEITEVIQEINNHRKVLGGKYIKNLTENEIKINISPQGALANQQQVNINVLKRNIDQLIKVESADFQKEIHDQEMILRDLVSEFHDDNDLLRDYSTIEIVALGISALDGSGLCPLCDTQWKPEDLEKHLNEKLESAGKGKIKSEEIQKAAKPLLQQISLINSPLTQLIKTITPYDYEKELKILNKWNKELTKLTELVSDPISGYPNHPFRIDQVERSLAPDDIEELASTIFKNLKGKFPDASPEQTAWDILTQLTVDVKAFETAKIEDKKAELFLSRATILHDSFIVSRDEILLNIYNEIKDLFVKLYQDLHEDEEEVFDASLEPDEASLDFLVNFYGRGPHPPNALHSEGHQDSMGVCLFLALYKKFSQDLIELIILDDVVMSVDCNHRRSLCNVISENFKDKQLLITTHDRIWANQLKYSGIVKSTRMYEFFNWDIEFGPQISDIVDIWSRIQQDIDNNDIPAAAAKLRRGGEQFFSEICDNLLAPVPYHMDGNYTLGDLLFPAMRQIKYLLKKAKIAKASWEGSSAEEIQILDERRKKIFGTVYEEQWAININVHFNDWANFTQNDFIPVVGAFKELFDFFICEKCDNTVYVILDGTDLNNLRCKCDFHHWNLVEKK